jgi:hypothetical protein
MDTIMVIVATAIATGVVVAVVVAVVAVVLIMMDEQDQDRAFLRPWVALGGPGWGEGTIGRAVGEGGIGWVERFRVKGLPEY